MRAYSARFGATVRVAVIGGEDGRISEVLQPPCVKGIGTTKLRTIPVDEPLAFVALARK
jgi:hypothetical protein